MTVDTPLALFTTLFGWQFYSTIWDVLLGSGIALLPFLGVLLQVLVTERADGNFVGADPAGLYRRLESQILVMLALVAIGAQPAQVTALGPTTLTHIPYATLLEPNPSASTPTTSDSTFDESALGDVADSVAVPVWWYAVMAVSQGINRAVLAELPEVDSLRDMMRLSQIANINDPALRAEVSAFYTDCFIPARSRFDRERPAGVDADDTTWMGSVFFQEAYYDNLRARRTIDGFPFDPDRDVEWLPDFAPQFGRPTCNDWWLGQGASSRQGLRADLLAAADQTSAGFLGAIENVAPFLTGQETEDVVIRRVLTNNPPSISSEDFRTFNDDPVGRVINGVGVNLIGASFFALFMDVVTLGAPMMQPLILMGIFTLLPFALVASRYSVSFLIAGAVVIFTVSFWPVLWYIGTWVDDQLLRALYPEEGLVPLDAVAGIDNLFGSTKFTLLSMITASLFLFLPLVFSAVMGMAGVRAVAAASSLTRTFSGGGSAVEQAAQGPQRVANIGLMRGAARGRPRSR